MLLSKTRGLQDRDPVHTESILSGCERIASDFNAPMVPIGRAWDNFYTSHNENPPFELFSDNVHAIEQGMALIAYMLFAYLTGDSPVNTPTLRLSESQALLLQNIALETVIAESILSR